MQLTLRLKQTRFTKKINVFILEWIDFFEPMRHLNSLEEALSMHEFLHQKFFANKSLVEVGQDS